MVICCHNDYILSNGEVEAPSHAVVGRGRGFAVIRFEGGLDPDEEIVHECA